ncbi:unnamed protein product, partial [Nezara viridula]
IFALLNLQVPFVSEVSYICPTYPNFRQLWRTRPSKLHASRHVDSQHHSDLSSYRLDYISSTLSRSTPVNLKTVTIVDII